LDTEPLDRHQRTLATCFITSSKNLQQIHLISRQQPPQQQSTKSIDLNMLNPTNLTEIQGTTRNEKKTVHSTCSPITITSQTNTLQSCSCFTTWTRKPWSGEQNLWQHTQSQDKVSILEPWKTSLQPSTQLFNYSIWKETVTNFIRPYLHQFSINSHGLNGYGKPLKRPFDRY